MIYVVQPGDTLGDISVRSGISVDAIQYWNQIPNSNVIIPGQALLLDCNNPHSYAAQGKCSFTFVHFAGGQSAAIYEEIERSGNLIHLPDSTINNRPIGMQVRRRGVEDAAPYDLG